MSELVLLGLAERAEAVLSSTPVPHRGHYSVVSVVADRERLIRPPGYLLLTGKKRASANERSFKAEISAAFKEIENINQSPVYMSQDILICLDCGHRELTFPAKALD